MKSQEKSNSVGTNRHSNTNTNTNNTIQLLYEAHKNACEAEGTGSAILEKLDNQEEHLRNIEDTLEANEYTLLKSMRILRGMTWSGTIYNSFTKDPEISDLRMNNEIAKNNQQNNNINKSMLFLNTRNNDNDNSNNIMNEEDKILNDISKTVTTLKDMSYIMGQHIENNNEALERIDQKATRTNDQTHAATLKASQITSRTKRSTGNYVGRYQFIEINTNHYVGVVGEDIMLLNKPDRSAYYNIYMKEANLFAAQNCKTLKYLGSTIWGPIKASGEWFGRQEEISVQLNGSVSGMFFLGKNFGGGGWLKYTENDPLLSTVTTGITDKENILLVRAIKCNDEIPNEID